MTSYIARVEISGGDASEYKKLHESMESIGFKRTIFGDNGKESELPTGTYVSNTPDSIDSVRGKIQRVASAVSDKTPQIIVCSFDRWSGYLTPAS
ncbi:type V toxin-antitoxin system endoribonuclease antitoxin GhoS [Citrobacter freundii]|uniref:type V toxin-antitoxin system endoribonuclease antitoxin GhoS n=1 Tax=Citrobacter freundii TaxID=546 RepID=UPI00244BCC03|nr:type V toxin-antitoxin system endoribonuclease antitoxin GhoS [Citrobacter freundii]MDH0767867.1 type V toxin-antitoxin system endoribonuclease antitoxin GhoS [Citrobacter freundii]MDH1808057.1 type V toxin-antitoxin system endoribonuclease antitoxin GhoS [Citrobacter freundii]MDH1965094.1 type V toxin-antitoxin system endoribonuclease antitoxin GhoS [Citrobacter freundii]